jgi:ubiquinone/menaquinone biosynthesis C-methylase UbiE
MTLGARIARQFHHPHGALGRLAGFIMANRQSNRLRNRWTLALLHLRPADRVLEIGFGPGYAVAEATRLVPQGKVIGIDHSATMLAQAAARNAEAIRRGQVELFQGDAQDLSVVTAPVDSIYSANVVQFWPNPAAVFTALRAVLKPGGTVATTYQPRHRGASAADGDRMAAMLQDTLTACEFVEIRSEKLPLDPPVICVLARKPAAG